MSYEPNTWGVGDVITAAKMNNIEDGVQEALQSSGCDAEIKVYHSNNSTDDYTLTIVSGSYASLVSMLNNGTAPFVLVRIFDELAGHYSASTLVSFYGWNNNIQFVVKYPTSTATGQYESDWSFLFLAWTDADELYTV